MNLQRTESVDFMIIQSKFKVEWAIRMFIEEIGTSWIATELVIGGVGICLPREVENFEIYWMYMSRQIESRWAWRKNLQFM